MSINKAYYRGETYFEDWYQSH